MAVRSVIEGAGASHIGTCRVTSVTLYQSRLGAGGATYTPLATGALRRSLTMPLLVVSIGYLAGSIPFAFLAGRYFRGVDIRRIGSGNVGAANVLRSTGALTAVVVMLLDAAKGAGAVLFAQRLASGDAAPAAAGIAAVVGHVYPLWLRFRGGKGVATAAGAFAVLTPLALAPAAAIFVATVWATRFISLGSIVATLALGPIALALGALGGRRWRGVRCRAPHRVSASHEHWPAARRHRAADWPEGGAVKQVAVLGAGSFGTALSVHLARLGHDGARVGARPRACARHGHAAREPHLPAGPDVPVCRAADERSRHRRLRCGSDRERSAVARHARGPHAGQASTFGRTPRSSARRKASRKARCCACRSW